MGRPARILVSRTGTTVIALAGIGYATAASATHPFTMAADVVTAIPLGGAVVVTAWVIGRQGPSAVGSAVDTSHRTGVRGRTDASVDSISRWRPWWVVWMATVGALVAWELYCLFNLPRVQHPTLSALIDMLDSTRIGKAIAFVLWLTAGWFLVTR